MVMFLETWNVGSGLITHNVIHILETQQECAYTLETWKVGFSLET